MILLSILLSFPFVLQKGSFKHSGSRCTGSSNRLCLYWWRAKPATKPCECIRYNHHLSIFWGSSVFFYFVCPFVHKRLSSRAFVCVHVKYKELEVTKHQVTIGIGGCWRQQGSRQKTCDYPYLVCTWQCYIWINILLYNYTLDIPFMIWAEFAIFLSMLKGLHSYELMRSNEEWHGEYQKGRPFLSTIHFWFFFRCGFDWSWRVDRGCCSWGPTLVYCLHLGELLPKCTWLNFFLEKKGH